MDTSTTSERTQTQFYSFERVAGVCGILTALVGIFYAISFLVLQNALLSAIFLMLGGLFATLVVIAVYERVRETEGTFALLALFLSVGGALGAFIHGGYDLANAINPITISDAFNKLPNPVDPRGLLSFGVTGLGALALAWLMGRSGRFQRSLSYWGYLVGVLLIVLYLGRLILLDPKNPLIAVDALLSGFIVNPIWYLWLGLTLSRGENSR